MCPISGRELVGCRPLQADGSLSFMKISHTELRDILTKVFEGMGFPLGDYEDCANTISWLALHGFPILDQIDQVDPFTQSRPTQILNEDEQTAVLDAQNNGGLIYGSLALDLAYLKAKPSGKGKVILKNGRFPQLLLPHLPSVAQRGFYGRLQWPENTRKFMAIIAPQAPYPTLYELIDPVELPDEIIITCTNAPFTTPDAPQRIKTPAQFEACCLRHIENGLTVKTAVWQQLVRLSKNILVEATETSRTKGAGEDAGL